jgi:hypothetical protein
MSDTQPTENAIALSPETPEQTLAALTQAATDFYTAFPDVNQCARQEAARILKVHTGRDLDPDTVYWHRFSNAISNPQTFTGWEHYGVPDQSRTMTELTQRRFDVNDQINAIDLDSMSGFYTADSTAGHFDQRNELALSPLTIMNDLWEGNFAQAYQTQLEAFWTAQGDSGRLVAKALCVSYAFEAMRRRLLSRRAFKQFIFSVAGPLKLPPTIAQLKRAVTSRELAEVSDLTLGGIAATGIIRVKNAQGHQTLYLPPDWFHTFHSEREVYEWFCVQAADPARREHLLSHFTAHHQTDSSTLETLNSTLDTMQRTPWVAGQTMLNGASQPITKDVFSYLIDNLRARLETEAQTMLTSNWQLRKDIFLVDLSAFVRVTAGIAPGDSLVAASVVGASAISLGAHLAVVLHGKTHEQRSKAAVAAALDALSLLFSLPMLKGSGKHILNEFADLAEEAPAVVETQSPMPYAVDIDLSVLPTEINGAGGLFYKSGDKRYIQLAQKVYEVEFIEVLDRWVVINPLTPDNLTGAWPVEANWRGVWEPYVEEVIDPLAVGADEESASGAITPQMVEAHRLDIQLRPYEVSMKYVELIEPLIGRDSARLMSSTLDDTFAMARNELLVARNELAAHARLFFNLPREPRSVLVPRFNELTTPDTLFEAVYDQSQGLVIGEAKDAIGSKKLLIKYMGDLKSQGVQTLYTDLLIKELHQGWLDHYLETGLMPSGLYNYLTRLTRQSILAKYTPLELIKMARLQGIKVKALDCAAAHQVHGLSQTEAGIGQKMRNYYAIQRIRAHQAARPASGWIALVDHTKVSTYQDVPGLADLSDTVGVRIKDVSRNTPFTISEDPGQRLAGSQGNLRTDLQIEMGTLPEGSVMSSASV